MMIYKFGGTSVGSPERMKEVADIISNPGPKVVVLSAVSGTTNQLVEINQLHGADQPAEAVKAIDILQKSYEPFFESLFEDQTIQQSAKLTSKQFFDELRTIVEGPFSNTSSKIVLAQGELMSTSLFSTYLSSLSRANKLLPALEFMRSRDGEPDLEASEKLLTPYLAAQPGDLYITQGYICRDEKGSVTNLQRGGSDYTATILGAILGAKEIQIWTDIDGVHNNDPRVVEKTAPLPLLSYREAAELAYFGAKILHPNCVLPAEKKGVPIRLKNTMVPDAPGTLISAESSHRAVAAVAAKDAITVVNIYSHRMLNAYGFLRQVFAVFENYKTPIDMITTSEVAVSLTIDDPTHLVHIIEELKAFGEVNATQNQTIVCIVGDALYEHTGYASKIFGSLVNIPIRMISYGGSKNNVSILIDEKDKKAALIAINKGLFE